MLSQAYILAGGKSQRFGADKATVEIDGQPNIARLRDCLSHSFEQVFVVADRNDRFTSLGIDSLVDLQPNLGPIGGLITALADRQQRFGPGWIVLTSVDQFSFSPSWIEPWREHATQDSHRLAIVFRDARWQPFPGCYHTNLQQAAGVAVASGNLSLQRLLDQHTESIIALETPAVGIETFNTREELDRLLKRSRPPIPKA